ncbi:MAG TPA: universal stress protein [Polyangia bacterium]
MSPAPPTKDGFRSLLVPVDLSPLSDRVVGRASSLPMSAGATVTLLHVIPPSLPMRTRRQAEKDARAALVGEALHMSKALGPRIVVEHEVTSGAPASEIARHAARVKADLITMGRGAGRPMRDAFLGSTAERVIRQGRRPVLVVRLPARAPYRRPTLGLDLDEAAGAVLDILLRVIPPPRPRVAVVHAHDAPYLSMAHASLSKDEIEDEERRHRPAVTARLRQLIARTRPAARGGVHDEPELETHVRFGDPRGVLKAAVKRLDTDLLVLGTHAHSGLSQAFLGTVAGDILRDVRCDVLVVPPRRPARRRR